MDSRILSSVTDDGVLLRMRRYARPGSPPVLLLHGWMQSPHGMDSTAPGRSMARHLHRAGHDVFVGCLRGHRDGRYEAGSHGHWTPVDHAALDLPALVRSIRRHTGRSPALVGHSLGGLVSLLYVAGASSSKDGLRPSAALARARSALIPGVIGIAPPILFPERSIGLLSDRPDLSGRLLCRLGASDVGGRLLERLPRIPMHRGLAAVASMRGLGRLATAGMVRVARSSGSRGFWRPENMSAEVVRAELLHTLDATSGAELREMARWVCAGGIDPQWRAALGGVATPVLLIAGERDGVVSARGVRQSASAIGSSDCSFLEVPDAGHNDLRVGDAAARSVYPALVSWLSGRLAQPIEVSAVG